MLEPFGDDQLGRYFGTLAATIANSARTKKSSRVWQWKDFFPPITEQKLPQTTEQQIAIVEQLNEAFGGKDLRKK